MTTAPTRNAPLPLVRPAAALGLIFVVIAILPL
jgi:hypothetical protein